MVEKNSILIRYYRNGDSIRSISKGLGLSRNTVRKHIRNHDKLRFELKTKEHLEVGLSTKPVYDSSKRKYRRLSESHRSLIDQCLKNNATKRSKGMHKQCMKKIDIYHYLCRKGHQIGYTTVCNYICKKGGLPKETFIKQLHRPGIGCEFDWGHVKLYIKGELHSLNIAVFTSCYSNYRWAKVFYRQDSLAFMQSHVDFIAHTNGVYKQYIYDNMRVAVARFVGAFEKEPTESLLELSNYYTFDFRFCNVRKGNEKGHVERSVEYVRRRAFSVQDSFESLSQANQYLLAQCNEINTIPQRLKNGANAKELLAQERSVLYPVAPAYQCFKTIHAKVDTYATVTVYQNRYSVPEELVGKLVKVHVFAEHLVVFYGDEQVCRHVRSYGANRWTLDMNHYLNTLYYKSGAVKGSLAFEQLDKDVKNLYFKHFSDSSKEFIGLLQYCKKHEICFSKVTGVEKRLQKITPNRISKDKIIALLEHNQNQVKTQNHKPDQIKQYALDYLAQITEYVNAQ